MSATRRTPGLALLATATAVAAAAITILSVAPRDAQTGTRHSAKADPREPALRHTLSGGSTIAAWVLFDSTVSIENNPRDRAELTRKLQKAGARIRVYSRWLNAISVDFDSVAAEEIALFREVARVQRVGMVYASAPSTTGHAPLRGHRAGTPAHAARDEQRREREREREREGKRERERERERLSPPAHVPVPVPAPVFAPRNAHTPRTTEAQGSYAPVPVPVPAPVFAPRNAHTPGTTEAPGSYTPQTAEEDSLRYGPNYRALSELSIPQAHSLGFTGRNIRIGIIDTGFETGHEVFAGLRVLATRDFIHDDANVTTQPSDPAAARDQEIHGTWVWSLLAGNRPGQMLGPAHGSEFLLAKVDVEQADGEQVAADEDRWVAAVEWLEDNRVRVINSSLSFRFFSDRQDYTAEQLNGNTAISTRVADEAASRGILFVTAAGNWPTGDAPATSISAPADADSVIAVGAIDSVRAVHPSSGRGPTADGRIKPELVARGVNLYVADSHVPAGYERVPFGTSLATPLVTGAAALLMQAWPILDVHAVREGLLLSGSNAAIPDNNRGYGVPDVASAILFPQGLSLAGVATIDLNGVITTIAPSFRWEAPLVHAQLRPVRYRLELATDPQFRTIVYSDTVSEAFSLQVREPLRPQSTLWWRVIATSFTGVQRVSATSGPLQMPNWVRLTTLNDPQGSHVATTRPRFEWEPLLAPAPTGPLTYDVQILNAGSGSVVQTMRNVMTGSVVAPEPLVPNSAYRWRVIARSRVGVADTVISRGNFVVTSDAQPPTTALYAPFPNPFPRDGVTAVRFWFDLAKASSVQLAIYNSRGLLVKNLVPARGCAAVILDSGQYGRGEKNTDDPCVQLFWDGKDEQGREVARGIYIARLRAGGTTATQRIVFLPTGS